MVRRLIAVPLLAAGFVLAASSAAFACGGLVAPGHAEALKSATTLAAWHAGYEHYVTGFEFAGLADSFGYIIPLPAVPTKITKGGNWTLERLQGEIGEGPLSFKRRGILFAEAAAVPGVQVLQQVKIDALNITVVRGGGPDVATWAEKNGFDLTPDAPGVLGQYSSHHAVFALAKFDRADARSRGLIQGQGEVIQFTIPTKAPWIPLRILALGKAGVEFVDAELFVLTDHRPSFFPTIGSISGMTVKANKKASASLLSDLRGDAGMSWVPQTGMWFTALKLRTTASTMNYDLSIDGGGPASAPQPVGAPLAAHLGWPLWVAIVGAAGLLLVASRERRHAVVPAR
jgi:hypothetical protein